MSGLRPALPDPRSPRDFPLPPLRGVGEGDGDALRSAGRAAPDPADHRGLSSGRGAVKALVAREPERAGNRNLILLRRERVAKHLPAPRPRPAAALWVTAARLASRASEVERSGGERRAPGAITGHVAHAPLSLGAADLAPRSRRAVVAGTTWRHEAEISSQYLRLSAALSAGTGRQVPALRISHQLTVRLATPAQGGN